MSPEVETAFAAQAQVLFAGFQELYQHPVTLEDVRRYPSVGRNAYTTISKVNSTTRNAPSPAAAAAAWKTASKATEDDTEDEDDIAIMSQSSRKRGRKAR